MEIEVGEYIRTTDGEIHKIKSIEGKFIEFENGYGISVREKDYILKHSKNIIDLIEVGDVVDYENSNAGIRVKKEVYYVCTEKEDYKWGEGYIYTLEDEFVMKEKIYSIVTKEQFKNIEYRLE